MKHLFHFEHRRQPLASSARFKSRLARNGLWGLGITLAALAILCLERSIRVRAAGYAVTVVEDACRGIGMGDSIERAWRQMLGAGVRRAVSGALA